MSADSNTRSQHPTDQANRLQSLDSLRVPVPLTSSCILIFPLLMRNISSGGSASIVRCLS